MWQKGILWNEKKIFYLCWLLKTPHLYSHGMYILNLVCIFVCISVSLVPTSSRRRRSYGTELTEI